MTTKQPRLAPRWRKVLGDLRANKTRTVLVWLSITIGVYPIGMVAGAWQILLHSLAESYVTASPASATLLTDPFGDDLVRAVRGIPSIREAEGRRLVTVRLNVGGDEWRDLEMYTIPDFNEIRLNRVWPDRGPWPPADRELLIERASLDYLGMRVDDSAVIEMPDGDDYELRIAGTAHDLSLPSTWTSGRLYGYVSRETLRWLDEPQPNDYNQLYFSVAQNELDRAHIARLAAQVRDRLEQSGLKVRLTSVPQPGKFWVDDPLQSSLLLLGALGLLSLFASGFLVINTISALLAQQLRQIGVMKAVGARPGQVIVLYLGTVLFYGVLALAVAFPLGVGAAIGVVDSTTRRLNLVGLGYSFSPEVLGLQAMAGLVLPVLAALFPVVAGSRVTVREAIGAQGQSGGRFGEGLVDRLLAAARGLPRPLVLSLRNTIRRKGRLAMTLATLTLGGCVFIAVLTVRDSLLLTLDDAFGYRNYDVQISFRQPHPRRQLEREALRVPGVVRAEGWGERTLYRIGPDGSESDAIVLTGLPAETDLVRPILLDGRWLAPQERNALVINTDVLRDEPDIRVGDEIRAKLDGQRSTWRVVGLVRGVLAGPTAYANYSYMTAAVNELELASSLQVVTEYHDLASQSRVMRALEDHFSTLDYRLDTTQLTAEQRMVLDHDFDALIGFLLVMAVMLAIVGGLGLMGTMSINVLERTREIGVMRAIGASDGAILRIVMVEGLLIGLVSWLLGSLLAFPLGRFLSDAVGEAFLRTPLSFTFSQSGVMIWLALVVALAALGSFLPAWNATRLTVRDVLAFE